jgi:hypothetical protein
MNDENPPYPGRPLIIWYKFRIFFFIKSRFIIKNTYFMCGFLQCLRTVIDLDDGMLSRRLAENRCGNFKPLNRPTSSDQWYAGLICKLEEKRCKEVIHFP